MPHIINMREIDHLKGIKKLSSRFTDDIIQLSHGDGGLKTGQLINGLVMKYLDNDILGRLDDSAVLDIIEIRDSLLLPTVL